MTRECAAFHSLISCIFLNRSSQENFLDDQPLEDGAAENEAFCPFTLPDEEFGEMMFSKRFKPDGSSSPLLLPNQTSVSGGTGVRGRSVVEDTDGGFCSRNCIGASTDSEEEPRSSPVSARGRGSARRGTRRSNLQEFSSLRVTKSGTKAHDEDTVDANQNEQGRHDGSFEEESEVGKQNPRNAVKSTPANVRKRRSVRRR